MYSRDTLHWRRAEEIIISNAFQASGDFGLGGTVGGRGIQGRFPYGSNRR